MPRRRSALHSHVAPAVLLLIVGCGGSTQRAPAAPSPTTPAPESGSGEPGAKAEPSARAAPRPICADGTCFVCGDGFCPQGFYCDETAKGGPACGWLPACAHSDCSCIGKSLAGAHCEESGGFPHVR